MLLICFLISQVSAQEFSHVVSNSEDWRDVYSSIMYANLLGRESDFLVSTRHSTLLLNSLEKNNFIRVVSSRNRPFVFNYPSMIVSRGFSGADEIIVDNANLELIDELPDITNFVIVGDLYGYNTIAAAPYALQTNSWVFFANRVNIAEIESILNNREVNDVLIYGYVDQEVRDALEQYNPEIIYNEDKFQDNIEIVKKYLELNPIEQVVLTNGEFIEKEIMSGAEPVLFTGRQNVPDQIAEYLKNSDIEVGVLIGNELVQAATNIRRTTGISVMVKFARGARAPATGISTVEGLDLFYLPSPSMFLDLHSVQYNQATSQLEITYKSESNIPIYFKGTITLISGDNERRVGDVDSIFIAPNDFKTVAYPGVEISSDELIAEIFTLYGETPSALDRILEARLNVSFVNVIDSCEIEVSKVSYHKQKERFIIETKNVADVDCYVDIELNNVLIGGFRRDLGTEGSARIDKGKTAKIIINEFLTDEDLADNEYVDLTAYYGEREDSLVKVYKGRFKLGIVSFGALLYVIMILIIIIVILIIFIIIIKRREEDEDEL